MTVVNPPPAFPATDEMLIAAIYRLSLNYRRNFDEGSAEGMLNLWRDHLADCDARDVMAAVTAIINDPEYDQFPTVAQFRDEVQIQGRDRMRREQPAGHHGTGPHDTVSCHLCGDSQFVIVQEVPLTVRPCQCDERRYKLWLGRHFRPGHICRECSAAQDRSGGRKLRSAPAGAPAHPKLPSDPQDAAQRALGDF